jgi:hypothetical protein
MDDEAIRRKLESLQRMAQVAGDAPEGQNAKRILESIVKKYKLNPEEFSIERKIYTIKVHRLKRYAMHLALFCKIPCWKVAGRPEFIKVDVDSLEYRMFYELLDEIKHQFNKKEHELRKKAEEQLPPKGLFCSLPDSLIGSGGDYSPSEIREYQLWWKNDALKSFMAGYMKSNFPYDTNLCTVCKKGKIVRIAGTNEGQCNNKECGTTYKFGKSSFRTHGTNVDEFDSGRNTNVKSLRHNKSMITQQ